MEEIGAIAIGVAVVVLLIVIIAALLKKKKINRYHYIDDDELERIEHELDYDSNSSSSTILQQPSQTRNGSGRENRKTTSQNNSHDIYSSLLYYVYFDDNTYGPFSLDQLKTYPLLENTLITTNTLNGSWYEAKYFECLDELFRPNLPFRIDADGVIVWIERE